MDIPARPDKSLNPWYEAREAYDEAIEGALSSVSQDLDTKMPRTNPLVLEPIDLDELRNRGDEGSFTVRNENIINGPEHPANNTATVMVYRGTGNGITQLVIFHSEFYWRSASGLYDWMPWRRVVSDFNIDDRLPTTSTTPSGGMGESNVLIQTDERHVGTDFPEDLLGDGLTERWVDSETEDVFQYMRRDDGFRGQYLVSSTQVRAPLTWDRFDGLEDISVFGSFYVTSQSANYGGGLIVRESGDSQSNKNGIIAGISLTGENTHLRLFEYVDDEVRYIDNTIYEIPNNQEYYIRLSVTGDQVRAKIWLFLEPEPIGWAVEGRTNVLGPGRTGFYSYGSTVRYRYLEVDAT